jgi:hypothetical protein
LNTAKNIKPPPLYILVFKSIKKLTISRASVIESRVDGVRFEDRLVPIDGIIWRQFRRVVVTEVRVDARGQVVGVRPPAFEPDLVAPLLDVVGGLDAFGNNLFGIVRSRNDETWRKSVQVGDSTNSTEKNVGFVL